MYRSMETIKQDLQLEAPDVADYLKLYSCENSTILLADWSGVLYPDRARSGCTTILDILSKQPFSRILNNNTKVTGHYPGALDWTGRVWFPEMFRLGVRYFAWVYSPAFYTQISTDEVIKMSSKVTIETFYEIADAREWLLSKPN